MKRNFVIQIEPIKLNITPFGFHKYALDYLEIADKWTSKSGYSPVPYFLYCRSIELGLKAYLLAIGKNLKYVKGSVGHDLTLGLKNSRLNKLDEIVETTHIEQKEIELANKYYKTKGFEYFFVLNHITGLTELPKLNILKEYSYKLLRKIKPLTDNTDVD
jgi:hypothetical protein